jgi:NADPH-dependent 2,4-dienoyl-CoA reductase/sulfur reductase-like enzyme
MFGRPLIADPELPMKLMQGRREDVRPCMRCNEDCVGRIVARSTRLRCAVNLQANNEDRFAFKKTENPKKVVVVGGGPAGCEAARVAAILGHRVTLLEKDALLGGQLTAAYTPAFKTQMKGLVTWFGVQLDKLGVDVRLNTEVNADCQRLKDADRIIVATGALPLQLDIEGMDRDNVLDAIEAHKKKELIGNKVVVCGGGMSGCDVALELAEEHGKDVTIVEMEDGIAQGLLFLNTASLFSKMEAAGIKQRTNSRVVAIKDDGVHIE